MTGGQCGMDVGDDVQAKVNALLTPDAAALAAVCADDDEEYEDLDTGDVTIQERDELATYIYVELPDDAPLPSPGSMVEIRGLETVSPRIEVPSPSSPPFSAEGTWKESVGSLLFVAAPGPPATTGKETETTADARRTGSYLCHTERILSFK